MMAVEQRAPAVDDQRFVWVLSIHDRAGSAVADVYETLAGALIGVAVHTNDLLVWKQIHERYHEAADGDGDTWTIIGERVVSDEQARREAAETAP